MAINQGFPLLRGQEHRNGWGIQDFGAGDPGPGNLKPIPQQTNQNTDTAHFIRKRIQVKIFEASEFCIFSVDR